MKDVMGAGKVSGYPTVSQSENQCGPRHIEDEGPGEHGAGTPVSGDRAAKVASNFPVGKSHAGEGKKLSSGASIDLESGKASY